MNKIIPLFLLVLFSCNTQSFYKHAQNGDLIFVEAQKEKLSGAISRVTAKNDNTLSYDHLGLVETDGKNKYILHAAPKNGSEKITLKTFIKVNQKDGRTQSLYRLKQNHQHCIPSAIEKANKMLGKPYNTAYILNENAYYCSDFVERAFRDCKIFELQPMTFINPKTQKTDDYWQKFYDELRLKVPEGELGCNPNGLSQSHNIEKIQVLKP